MAALENTHWKLIQLGAQPVVLEPGQREPYFVLSSSERRVQGYGGCNRLTGSYTLEGAKLHFGQMASTMMACPDGMAEEAAFLSALQSAASWKITGDQLELFGAGGELLARFESRHLK